MKAPDFEYLRPEDLDAALSLLAKHDGDALPLAGGQSLMPMMNFRVAAPEVLIDLADISELRGIALDGDTVKIGAMMRYAELMSDDVIQTHVPLFGMALPYIAHDAIRNRGTLGGSLALADPAAEMPALMLALDATLVLAGEDGTRNVKADDFFLGYFDTDLDERELIVEIQIPAKAADQTFGFHELTQRHGDYALAGVAVAQSRAAYRAAFFGVADRAIRVPDLEQALADGGPEAALEYLSQIDFSDDHKANATTRQRLAGVALTRALDGMVS